MFLINTDGQSFSPVLYYIIILIITFLKLNKEKIDRQKFRHKGQETSTVLLAGRTLILSLLLTFTFKHCVVHDLVTISITLVIPCDSSSSEWHHVTVTAMNDLSSHLLSFSKKKINSHTKRSQGFNVQSVFYFTQTDPVFA